MIAKELIMNILVGIAVGKTITGRLDVWPSKLAADIMNGVSYSYVVSALCGSCDADAGEYLVSLEFNRVRVKDDLIQEIEEYLGSTNVLVGVKHDKNIVEMCLCKVPESVSTIVSGFWHVLENDPEIHRIRC